MALEYYVVDVETTGTSPNYHEITEISIIRCRDRHQITKRIKAEYPERASDKALEVTGRTLSDIIKGDDYESVIESCNAFLSQDEKTPEHRCMIAHNAQFDRRFIHALWKNNNLKFPANNWFCTLKFSRNWAIKVGSKPDNFQLHTVLKFADIQALPGIHDAESDARNTYLLWKKGMERDVDYLSAIKRIPHELA